MFDWNIPVTKLKSNISTDAKDGNILDVRVDSGEGEGGDVCAIVSVQRPGGPVWDDEARIREDEC